jgi:hypothetical protein
MIGMTAVALAGCGRDAALTGPSPTPTPSATSPSPSPSTPPITLRGRVTESAPTMMTGVGDATVTLTNATGSWESPLTIGGQGLGHYTIAGLQPGQFTANVSANGYVSVSRQLTLESDTVWDFHLLPVPTTKSFTFTDQITDTDGVCSDGTQSKPCRISVLPIHNAGPLEATLTWKAEGPAILTVTLFQSGQATPIARSTTVDATTQRLTADLLGLAVYELHILFVSGTGSASYEMPVMYQN